VGARGWRKSGTVTLPLMTPGYVAGALLVFIWPLGLRHPAHPGRPGPARSQAYLNIVQFVDRRIFRMGIVISALMVILAVSSSWSPGAVGLKDYASLSYTVGGGRPVDQVEAGGRRGVSLHAHAALLHSVRGVALASFSKGWSLTPLPLSSPSSTTSGHRGDAEVHSHSFLYSGLAVACASSWEVPIAWVLARSRLPGRGALDSINTLILAVPAPPSHRLHPRLHFDLPGFDRGLTSFWIIMPIVLAVRRLPYTVRAPTSLLLVHRSMEEAARAWAPRTADDPRHQPPLDLEGIVVGSLFPS